jgi:hypothetical protein
MRPFFYQLIISFVALSCHDRKSEIDSSSTIGDANDSLKSEVNIDTVDRSKIDKELLLFLSKFNRSSIESLLNKNGVLIIQPSVGVNSDYSIANNLEDLLAINALIKYLSDSSASIVDRFYQLKDKCELEELPSGIYFRPITFDSSKEDYFNTNATKQINDLAKASLGKSGYEIALNFTDKTNTNLTLFLVTLFSDQKLILCIIDQRECGV